MFLFAGAVLLGATATRIDNRELHVALPTGQPAAPVVASGPEIRIAPGKRAIAIRVDDVASWIDLLQPDSRVDILLVTNAHEAQRPVAKLLMEDMRLLAIAAVPERLPDGREIKTVVASIEVTADEGERLAIVGGSGSLRLILRGYGEPDSVRFGPDAVVIPETFKTPKPWVSPFQQKP